MRLDLVPTNEIVIDPDDIEYVNRNISASGVPDATVRAVRGGEGSFVSSSISFESRQSPDAFESSTPTTPSASISGQKRASKPTTPSNCIKGILNERLKQLDTASPDSKARCTSRDCPLQGIEQMVGRYFHNSEDALIIKESFISQFFNHTVPPPNIVEAWIRMNEGRASQDDRDQVRQYQNHHMWSPVISEPSSPLAPLPKRAFPVRDDGAKINEGPGIDVISPTHNEPTRSRPLCSADFESSDDEDDINDTDIWKDASTLLLQAKILREIAEFVHEPDADYRPWDDAVAGWADE